MELALRNGGPRASDHRQDFGKEIKFYRNNGETPWKKPQGRLTQQWLQLKKQALTGRYGKG